MITSGQRERNKMLDKKLFNITDLSVCFHCEKSNLDLGVKKCPNCGFPQNGNQMEMKIFKNKINNKKRLLKEHKTMIAIAKYLLFGFAFLIIIVLVLTYFSGAKMHIIDRLFMLGSAAVYIILGLWSNKKPADALLVGLLFFVIPNIIVGIFNPAQFLNAIFMKITVVMILYYGYQRAKKVKKLENELSKAK